MPGARPVLALPPAEQAPPAASHSNARASSRSSRRPCRPVARALLSTDGRGTRGGTRRSRANGWHAAPIRAGWPSADPPSGEAGRRRPTRNPRADAEPTRGSHARPGVCPVRRPAAAPPPCDRWAAQGRGLLRVQRFASRRPPVAAQQRRHTSSTSSACAPVAGWTSAQSVPANRMSWDLLRASPHNVWFVPWYQACTTPAGLRTPSGSCQEAVDATAARMVLLPCCLLEPSRALTPYPAAVPLERGLRARTALPPVRDPAL